MGRQEDNIFLYVSSSGNAFENCFFFFDKVFSNSAVCSFQVLLVNAGGRPTRTTYESADDNAYFCH